MNETVIEPEEWDPADIRLPEEILSLANRNAPKKGSARSRRREKTSPEKTSRERGRFVRAVAAGKKGGRIAVAATLRAAAPFQRERRRGAKAASGRPAIRVIASDLRYKQFKQKSGTLVIFAVDSSGSMAANRIHLAKGAVLRLLERSYLNRDKVAVITFRGKGAEVLLPPTQSVELAKRVLDHLPVGGGTPLASGLEAALTLARRNRPGDAAQKLLVVVTDGTANVTRSSTLAGNPATIGRETVWRELEEICALLRREGLESVVIDTRDRHVTGGEAKKLAGLLGGRHVHLAHADSGAAYETLAASQGGRNRTRRAERDHSISVNPLRG
jgi:magnesium chelatase subunit D